MYISHRSQFCNLYLSASPLLVLLIVLFFAFLSVEGVAQQSEDQNLFSLYTENPNKNHYHKWSVGVGFSLAAPVLTSAAFISFGNERFGYLSYGYRGMRKTTSGVEVRYDKGFTIDKDFGDDSGVKPCIMGSVNFNQSTTQSESSFLFPSEITYRVGRHRTISGGIGFDVYLFSMKHRVGLRTMCVFSKVIDEFGIFRSAGYGFSDFASKIRRKANVPCQLNVQFTMMLGRVNDYILKMK